MVAPTNAPVVSSVPLFGPSFLLGQVTNLYQPTKLATWNVVIPSSLLGNEAQAGYAAFTSDGVTVTRGFSGAALANFVGFFENQYFNEWNVGSLSGSDTLGNYFTTTVCSQGSIYVYNSTAMVETVASGLGVITVYSGSAANVFVGAVVQGTVTNATILDISSVAKVRSTQPTVGGGVLIDVLTSY